MAWFSDGDGSGRRVFEGLAPAKENFRIVATHVRHGQEANDYVLKDGSKLESIVDKWRFEPKSDPLSRCGYDYQVVVTNGDVSITVSICFVCKTLVLNGKEKYAITKKRILTLFSDDFEPLN